MNSLLHRRAAVPGAILLSLFFCACSGRTPDDPPGPPPEGEIGSACQEDAVCKSGSCWTDPSFPEGYCTLDCSSDPALCPERSTCYDYLGYKQCLSACSGDDGCRQGYVCDYGVCQPPCNRNEACKAPDLCLKGRCKGACKLDSECASGERCQDGKCLPPCKLDTECIPGNACNTTTGRCEPQPGTPFGGACANGKECATGYCLPTHKLCSVKCTASGQCPSGYLCALERIDKDGGGTFDSAENDCVPVVGKGVVGSLCQKDADCASGYCYNGFCMEGCAGDGDCGSASLQCVEVSVLLEGGIPKLKGCLPRKGISTTTLGSFKNATVKGVDIPPNASSFVLTTEVASTTEVALLTRPTDPKGTVLSDYKDQCDLYSQPIRYYPSEQITSFYVPNTPAVTIKPGVYTFTVQGSNPSLPITVRLLLKLGKADKGTLNLNWHFLNLSGTCIPAPTLNAASAPTHSWLGKVRNNLITILKTAGLTVGKETFKNISNAALDTIELQQQGDSPELQQLFASSAGQQGSAINIFFVRKIETKGIANGMVLGIAGGIPGPIGIHGTVHSGIAMSMETACLEQYGYNPGHTLAHELGHYLGLYHNQEQDSNPGLDGSKVVCPCPCGPNLSCQYDRGLSWCRGEDPIPDTTTSSKNLMYWAAESTQMFDGNQLTAGQVRVVLDNPLVGH